MNAPVKRRARLVDRLPAVRGRLRESVPLSKLTWMRVGGPAEILFRPEDEGDLAAFLAGTPADVAVTVIGAGSNLLVRDGGVRGVVVRLGRGLAGLGVDGTEITAGAGATCLQIATAARDHAIAGLEFLSGIPGVLGGALRMNAGAYGVEIKDVAVSAEALDRSGARQRIDAGDMGFAYRGCAVPADWIFTSARLSGRPGVKPVISRRIMEIQVARNATQPIRTPTGGSTFVNPPGSEAWRLIERAGCRGLRRGAAAVSEKHCNFLINTGEATAAELEGLGEEVRRRVLEATGVRLEWEIQRLGDPASDLAERAAAGGVGA